MTVWAHLSWFTCVVVTAQSVRLLGHILFACTSRLHIGARRDDREVDKRRLLQEKWLLIRSELTYILPFLHHA